MKLLTRTGNTDDEGLSTSHDASTQTGIGTPEPGVADGVGKTLEQTLQSVEHLLNDAAITPTPGHSSFVTESDKPADNQVDHSALDTAAIIELTERICRAADINAGCSQLANELCQHLNADQVAIGYRQSEQHQLRLIAKSDVDRIDRLAEETRSLESVLQECLIREDISAWPPLAGNSRHALLAHQQFPKDYQHNSVISLPLRNDNNQIMAVIVVSQKISVERNTDIAEKNRPRTTEQTVNFLRAAERPIISTLDLLDRASMSISERCRASLRKSLTGKHIRLSLFAMVIAAAILAIPMKYRIRCDVELQPVARRYVAAPFDGPLQECIVRPGDIVQENTLLARMDDREIQWELAGIQADLNRAANERNSFLAKHETSDAEIARHELQRLTNREQLLQHRNSNLEIRSPSTGVVVSGDHRNAEGVPLKTGQTLFEIAPLDQMIIEVAIPEDDIPYTQPGMQIAVQLNAIPDQTLEGTISTISPRAELHHGDNVFIAETIVDNTDHSLRPGMQGRAVIYSDSHSLGWNLFHKPTAYVTGWLGW